MENNLSRNELRDKLIDLIITSLKLKHIDRSTVNESTALVRDGLNLDSIDILELVVNLEKTFQIKLNESESYVQHFQNIGTVIDFIQQASQPAPQPNP